MKKVRREGQFQAVEIPPELGLWALHALEDAIQITKDFDAAPDLELLGKVARAKWQRDRHSLERHTTSAVLFAGLAVEAFLNTCGVVRLGSDFYDENCERLEPTQKLVTLVLALTGELVDADDKIFQVTKSLAKARNAAAHPKSGELSWDEAQEKYRKAMKQKDDGGLSRAKRAIADMTLFFREFRKICPDTERWMNPRVLKGDAT